MGRLVGIDYGSKRIGVALSDELQIIASALSTLAAARTIDESCKRLADLLAPYKIEQVIVGMPLRLNGQMGNAGDEVAAFIERLKTHLSCPIVAWDERLTTVQAERMLQETRMTRKKRSKVIDRVAAVLILQTYLDHKHFQRLMP